MLGVNDRGEPKGKPFDEGLEKTLWEIVHEIDSPGAIELHGLRVGEIGITVISVARRDGGVAQTPDGTLLARRGKQNLPLRGDALVGLVSQRTQERFDFGLLVGCRVSCRTARTCADGGPTSSMSRRTIPFDCWERPSVTTARARFDSLGAV